MIAAKREINGRRNLFLRDNCRNTCGANPNCVKRPTLRHGHCVGRLSIGFKGLGCSAAAGGFKSVPSDNHQDKSVQLGRANFRFGLDTLTGPDGKNIDLRAQSFAVLKCLLSNLNQLISRDSLIQQVWGNIAVTDDSLTQCITDIRRAIKDTDRAVLQTVPKRGYRLIGHELGGLIAPNLPLSVTAPRLSAQLDPRDVLPTLAVLPFQSDNRGDVEIFGTILGNEIASQLCNLEDVNLLSGFSTGLLGDRPRDPKSLIPKLNADFILGGYLVAQDSRVSVSLEFFEAESGYVLWSDRMQLQFDPLHPEIEGLELIVGRIRRTIMINEARRVTSRPLGELKLFSLLYGAVDLMHRLSPKDFQAARELLDHLIASVPKHPTPLAWLARWHVLNSVQGWAPNTGAEKALELTARALDLDPEHTHALVCEGQALVHLARRLDDAEDRYDTALANSPNDAQGRTLRGMLRAFSDRGEEGTRDTERALHLTPLDPHRFFYLALAAGACIAVENFERAEVLAKESLRLNKTHVSTLRMLAVAQLGAGDGDAARKTATKLMAAQPDLRVGSWLRSSPSGKFSNGKRFANMLRDVGVPD